MSQWGKSFRNTVKQNLGVRGSSNIAAWATAGLLAYWLWIRPERQAEIERRQARERMRQFSREKGLEDIDRIRPIADPQDTGLVRGKKS